MVWCSIERDVIGAEPITDKLSVTATTTMSGFCLVAAFQRLDHICPEPIEVLNGRKERGQMSVPFGTITMSRFVVEVNDSAMPGPSEEGACVLDSWRQESMQEHEMRGQCVCKVGKKGVVAACVCKGQKS